MENLPVSILVVDDERDFVEMLCLRLEGEGHRVRGVYSGQDALKAISRAEPDVVVLDIKMPGMDGIETLKAIKADHPMVEVILLTGHGAIDTAVQGMKAGAFDYLLKPADFDELTQKTQQGAKSQTGSGIPCSTSRKRGDAPQDRRYIITTPAKFSD
jgi:DNA-binding NtrC family response regulator